MMRAEYNTLRESYLYHGRRIHLVNGVIDYTLSTIDYKGTIFSHE